MPYTHTLTIRGETLPIINAPIHDHWSETAQAKGFEIAARIQDRYHLAVACERCGQLSKTKLYVLMQHMPLCPSCLERAWNEEAEAAGVTFLRRDDSSTAYAWYRLRCGHEARRQIGLISRVARGETGLRCGTCHEAVEVAEAQAAGWELLGPDPEGDTNYRWYRHIGCGHEQRIARANLQTQRFDCAGCGTTWTAAPSHVYLFRILLPNGVRLLKLGMSRIPASRLHHQLLRHRDLVCHIRRILPVPSGHRALCEEKRLHSELRRDFPEAVIPASEFAEFLHVRSEVYAGWLEPEILKRLDELEDALDGEPENGAA